MATLIIETSALVSIIRAEPEELELTTKVMGTASASMSAPSYLEAFMVLKKCFGDETERVLGSKLRESGITLVPFGPEHLAAATLAFDRYGKGRHPAALNFGDRIAYSLAQVSGRPLLFVGDDFAKTDVRIA